MRRLCETMFVYVMSVILKESHWLSVIYVLCISGGQSVQVIYGGGGGGCFISLREPLLSPQMPVNIDWAPYLTVTAKCHIRILEHFILSTLCHIVTGYLPSSARTRTTPDCVLSVTSYFWGARGGQCECRSHPGVTQESPVTCHTPASEETWHSHVTTSVTPVIRPVVK